MIYRSAHPRFLGCVVIAVACVALTGCWSKGAPGIGDKAQGFQVKSLKGDVLVFEPTSDAVRILYFWADWCARCEDDFRMIDRLYAKWNQDSRRPRFVAMNVGQSEEHVENFSNRMKVSFPLYMDRDGKIARSLGVKGLPTYFVIDRDGTIRHIILGWADEKALKSELGKIDGEASGNRPESGNN